MLSIVICSREEKISDSLVQNIKETIGCAYELIIINNSRKSYSIYEAYNLGLDQSQGEFICFLHDDLHILTRNWGNIVKEIFKKFPTAGLLGLAGGKIKTKMPSTWWDGGCNILKIVQHYKDKPKEVWNEGFLKNNILEVANIDGVFMAMRRDNNIRFDERLKGFHNYDLNLSILNRIAGKSVLVTNKILIEHFSAGSLNKSWYESSSKFHRIYKDQLPIIIDKTLTDIQMKKLEFELGHRFVKNLIAINLYREAYYWWFQLFLLRPFSLFHLAFIKKFLLHQARRIIKIIIKRETRNA